MDSLGIALEAPTKKLFLARGHSRRSYNQEDLLKIAQRHGFEAFYPEKHSFREQVETFARAKCIVGPSGAAFANSIFCQKDTRLLSWLVSNYSGFCSYSNIATAVGTQLRYMFVDADTEIKSTFDAYNATYNVDEAQFEQTLETMLTSPDW
ncbi:glycosyltransferase family 61 protein [Roseovarius sp.]